jgi:hypothetical protein
LHSAVSGQFTYSGLGHWFSIFLISLGLLVISVGILASYVSISDRQYRVQLGGIAFLAGIILIVARRRTMSAAEKFDHKAVTAIIAAQSILTVYYAPGYAELVRVGAAPIAAILISVPASICLCLAAILSLCKSSHSQYLYIIAAAGLGWSLLFLTWYWPNVFLINGALGAALGLLGWRLDRNRTCRNE